MAPHLGTSPADPKLFSARGGASSARSSAEPDPISAKVEALAEGGHLTSPTP